MQFFPISRVAILRSEVLTFKQEEQESLGMAWDRFNAHINTGPNLAIQDPILLQHFYMGLDRKTSKRLDMASGGSFLHVSANSGRSILTKILDNTPEKAEKKLLEDESQIVEPQLLSDPSPASAIPNPEPPKKEETPILDFMVNSRMNFLMNMERPRIIIP